MVSMNLKDLITDDDLKKRLEKIEQVMKEDYLPVWYIHFPHYTDHGISHCESVESKLNEFIPDGIKNKLNEYEIFFLLCAVWLHDIGMTTFDNCEGITRERHHELGRALIRNDEIKGIHLNEHEKAVVGELVFGHCAEIDDIQETTRIERSNNKSETIGIRYLTCLLRLADVCDVSHNRTHGVILACQGIDQISKVHHELHHRITSIEFDNIFNKIIIYATIKSKTDMELLEKTIVNNIQKELCSSAKILHPRITYNYVHLKISYDDFKKEIEAPAEFYSSLKNNTCFECAKKMGPSQLCVQIHEKKSELNIEHLNEDVKDKSKIVLFHGLSDLENLKEIFNSRWITTFNVVETRSFNEIQKSLEDGLPVIIVGNRDSGKTSFIYAMLKTFILNNWHVAVYEKDETLKDEDFELNSPLLIAVDDLHAFEISEQNEIFKLYKTALRYKCGFLASYRLENENDIGHSWINEISHIKTKCVLPDLSIKELKEIIKVHSKEKGLEITDENVAQFAWKVSKYSNMPAHIAYSFLSKEKGDIISSDDIEKIPPELNELIENVVMKLDENGEKIMTSFKAFNAIGGGDNRFIFKYELKVLFSIINDRFSDAGFTRGINSLVKLGIIQEIDSSILTIPKEGFLDQISLELKNIDIDTIKDGLKNGYLNIFKTVDLTNKQDNLAYSLALLSNYERIKRLELPVVDFISILASKNKELARIVIFKKNFDEPKDVQKAIFGTILPYSKDLKDENIDTLFQLATIYQYIDENDNAIETLNGLLLKYPENSRAYHQLGHIFYDLEKYPQAIEHMEKAVTFGSKYYNCLGLIYKKVRNYNKAIEVLNKTPDAKKGASFYHTLGHIYSDSNNNGEAIENMERAANLDPQYFDCLGGIYNKAEFTDKAIESCNKAIIYDSKNGGAYHQLGHIYSKLDKYPQAIENMEKAANLDPQHFSCLGTLYYATENFEKAIESLNKVIENNQNDSKSIGNETNLLEVLLGVGRYNEVNTYATEILKTSKTHEANLTIRFIVLCSELFNANDNLKKSISEYIQYYNKSPVNFDSRWNFDSIITMIKKRDLSDENKKILMSLIELLKGNISIDEFKMIFAGYDNPP